VISPEGCASILWRTAERAPQAAEAMKVTAQDLAQLGVIDRIVKEPVGGAHRNAEATAKALGDALGEELEALSGKTPKQLRRLREDRFLGIGDRRHRRGRRRQAEG
jgi:acetyl-CoA carboxylase carboxyl transferase subunit alpha